MPRNGLNTSSADFLQKTKSKNYYPATGIQKLLLPFLTNSHKTSTGSAWRVRLVISGQQVIENGIPVRELLGTELYPFSLEFTCPVLPSVVYQDISFT